ncbi:MAG: ATP-grasp domain-containing protein [Phascolarctobacterium sp.]|nr:ATP-grasp domain-containing protein [Phascolarctobacterium sp.]
MKNFIFISPNFPTNYWHFCHELKANGMNVLGIGDQAYDTLLPELQASLTEYYKVNSMENYDEVYRAVAFFIHKYGRIDWLESNNEYWLEKDAQLRTDFHITSGFQTSDMARIKYKSGMKPYYQAVGIPTAKYHIVDDLAGCQKFIAEVGYPVIVKPDNGVGASRTYKLKNEAQLVDFLKEIEGETTGAIYIMEEFVNATVNSYDAIINSNSEPVFETGNVTVTSIMDVVNNSDTSIYYIQKNLPEDIKKAGRATVKSFGVKNRFVHFEFFRLDEDHEGLGKKGDVIALEVNMRPSGGISPDMMNYANSTNVYKIWADMICFDKTELNAGEHYYCAFAGRRDERDYALSDEEVKAKYGDKLVMVERVAKALSGAMGDQMYIARLSTEEEKNQYYVDLCKEK